MPGTAREFLAAIERPLRYVQTGNTQQLRNVKNLSSFIVGISKQALAKKMQDQETIVFRSLQHLFLDFEDLGETEKKERIQKALALIEGPPKPSAKKSFQPEEHLLPDLAQLKEAHKKLSQDVRFVKGVGPAMASKFYKSRITTVGELLTFFPTRYEDRRTIVKISRSRRRLQGHCYGRGCVLRGSVLSRSTQTRF